MGHCRKANGFTYERGEYASAIAYTVQTEIVLFIPWIFSGTQIWDMFEGVKRGLGIEVTAN